jgi:hypothetical protein
MITALKRFLRRPKQDRNKGDDIAVIQAAVEGLLSGAEEVELDIWYK